MLVVAYAIYMCVSFINIQFFHLKKEYQMEIANNIETRNLYASEYPESVAVKTVFNLQSLLWVLIAIVLYAIYRQQPDQGTTLGIIQITLIMVCVVLAVVKLVVGVRKLVYMPTNSPVTRTEKYYNRMLESDIRQCMTEANISRLNALKTDNSGGILVETLESKDRVFIAARMHKYCPEGYRPETGWRVLRSGCRI